MTVKVTFDLKRPAGAAPEPPPQPLVLGRDATDWTLNGTSLLDSNLTLRLREVIQTRADKQLHVDAAVSSTYAQLVGVLGSAMNAGVEGLYVLGGGDPKQTVRVSLGVVSGPETDVRLHRRFARRRRQKRRRRLGGAADRKGDRRGALFAGGQAAGAPGASRGSLTAASRRTPAVT